MSRNLLVLLSIVTTVGLCAGCGSGGSTSDSGSTADSTAATAAAGNSKAPAGSFAAEATKLCDEIRQKYLAEIPQVVAEAQKTEGSQSPEQIEAKAIQIPLSDSLQEKVKRVRALGIPKGDEEQVEAILAAIEDVAEKVRTEPAKFLYQQSHFEHPFFKARHLADAYGIGHCARA